jgi:RecA/RadA recombinase
MAKAKDKDADVKKKIKNIDQYVRTGREVYEEKSDLKTLSISPALDFALNGGLLEGTWVQVSGPAKAGKTSTILQIAANAQKEGRRVIYLDAEGRIKSYNLDGIIGLDLDKIELIQGDGNEILTAEDFLNMLEIHIKRPENKGAVFIIDSLSSLIPAKELDGYVSGDFRPGLPKLLSNFCKRMGQVVPKTKAIVIAVHHLIATQATGPFAKQSKADGGNKIGYQYDTQLEVAFSKNWIEKEAKVGQIIHWNILTSALGTEKVKALSYFRFNEGLDAAQEIVSLADDLGVFHKSKSWFTLSFLEDHLEELGDTEWDEGKYRFNGKAQLSTFLKANPKVVELINREIKEIIG